MTTYKIKAKVSSNAYGVAYEVFEVEDGHEASYVGTFTRLFWAEEWIKEMTK